VRVVPNALELRRSDERPVGGRAAVGLRLTFIGQHTPFKGLDVLMEAVTLLAASAPNALARVNVYGGGSERFSDDFHQRIDEFRTRGAPLVRFGGSYRQDDLAMILDEADAIVVPSIWWENSPVVIEEALARRVPVICSDIGGMAEKVRHGVDGWHFQAGNAAALAELLLDLSRRDSLELPEMRRPTDTEEVVSRHLEVYCEAIQAAKRRGCP
jgi:glycosyltransferase involved in cell wall biosynthesis